MRKCTRSRSQAAGFSCAFASTLTLRPACAGHGPRPVAVPAVLKDEFSLLNNAIEYPAMTGRAMARRVRHKRASVGHAGPADKLPRDDSVISSAVTGSARCNRPLRVKCAVSFASLTETAHRRKPGERCEKRLRLRVYLGIGRNRAFWAMSPTMRGTVRTAAIQWAGAWVLRVMPTRRLGRLNSARRIWTRVTTSTAASTAARGKGR